MTDTAELIAKLRAKNMHLNDLGRTALIEDPDCIEAADALASLVRERDEARADNERDRSIIIDARNAIHDAIARRSWLLSGGRGSYEWDDDRWRDEFGAAIDEIGKPLEILERLGVNWVNCPTDHASIVEARIDWKARATAAEADAARMREALEAGGGTAVTEDGVVLTIQISGSTLANAIKHMPKAEIFDEGLQDFFHPEIVDEVAFLKEMAGALRCEEEDGTTLVHRMLDEAAIHIMHVGGDGVLSAQEVRDRARNALGGKDE